MKKGSNISMALIIIMFIFFWPVGLFLLIMRISESSKSQHIPPNQSTTNQGYFQAFQQRPYTRPAVPENKSVTCDGCGAPNSLKGYGPFNCEYCGKALS